MPIAKDMNMTAHALARALVELHHNPPAEIRQAPRPALAAVVEGADAVERLGLSNDVAHADADMMRCSAEGAAHAAHVLGIEVDNFCASNAATAAQVDGALAKIAAARK